MLASGSAGAKAIDALSVPVAWINMPEHFGMLGVESEVCSAYLHETRLTRNVQKIGFSRGSDVFYCSAKDLK